eukprot:Em0005g813a
MSTYTQSFCSCCERSRHRAITAKTEVVHHRCSVKPLFQWEMHSDQECKFQARTILEQLTCQLFHLLEAACHQLDLELALHITDFTGPSSSFSKYSQELQNLSFLQAELEKAQQSHEELQNMATYMALVNGEKSPLAVNLIKQSAAKMKSVKALKAKVAKGIATVQKGFSEKEGPFVKQLDRALQLIGVQCQQYFGGAFVGNHVHKALKLPNVKTLCTAISQMAQEKLPHRSGEVAENMKNFINLFSLFGKCHNISDQNFIDEPQIHALGQAIEEFMAFFQQQQSQSKCT